MGRDPKLGPVLFSMVKDEDYRGTNMRLILRYSHTHARMHAHKHTLHKHTLLVREPEWYINESHTFLSYLEMTRIVTPLFMRYMHQEHHTTHQRQLVSRKMSCLAA